MAEKLIDILQGHVTQEALAPWAGQLPTLHQVVSALRNVLLVLHDMLRRTVAAHRITDYCFGGTSSSMHAAVEAIEKRLGIKMPKKKINHNFS